jgi:amino acid permease
MPLSLQRDISAFRYVSLASIGALLYTGIVLLIEMPGEFKINYQPAIDKNAIHAAYIDFNILTGCSMTFFAFQC